MDTFVMVAQLLAGLSLLVIVHEFGHFIAARAFGMRVEKFYLFFDAYGKKLFSFKKGDTEYGIGWLPLGGYVKISGMVDESMDKDQIEAEPQPWEFRSKPAWQRLIVMLGGIILNIVLGYIIFTGKIAYFGEQKVLTEYVNDNGGIYVPEFASASGFMTGDKILKINNEPVPYFNDIMPKYLLFSENSTATVIRDGEEKEVKLSNNFLELATDNKNQPIISARTPFVVDSIMPKSEALKAGLQKGDKIIGVNEESIYYFDDLTSSLSNLKGETTELKVLRNGDSVQLNAKVTEKGTLGFAIAPAGMGKADTLLTFTFGESLLRGWSSSKEALVQQAIGIKSLIVGKLNFMKSVSSPIGIAKIYGSTFNWQKFWFLTGLLSFVLAIMNLLPIPALDGGHVVFLLIEIVRGKPMSDNVMMKAQMVGFIIIMGIMVLAVFSDLFFK